MKNHYFSLGIDLYLKLDWLALGGTSVLGYFFCCWVGPVPYLELFWAGPVKKVTLYFYHLFTLFHVQCSLLPVCPHLIVEMAGC